MVWFIRDKKMIGRWRMSLGDSVMTMNVKCDSFVLCGLGKFKRSHIYRIE